MIWMALIMALPVLGLVLFAIYPWQVALAPYLILVAFSGYFDWVMMRAMHQPSVTGQEGVAGSTAVVLRWQGKEGQVKWRGEIWRAYLREGTAPVPGETVVIDKVSGLWLFVKSVREIPT